MKAWRQAHREEIKDYNRAHKEDKKAWYQAHKEESIARAKAHYQAHKEEKKAYAKAWKKEHKNDIKAYYQAHREEHKDYMKAYNKAHKDEKKAWEQAHREDIKVYQKSYKKSDTNYLGQTKDSIRRMSRCYLFKTLRHTKVEGYEIHHCFGYDDFKHFIYIPKELHLQIHQFLRDNGIDADSDHYSKIEHLIVNYLKLNNRHVLIMHNKEDKNA